MGNMGSVLQILPVWRQQDCTLIKTICGRLCYQRMHEDVTHYNEMVFSAFSPLIQVCRRALLS